jgi:elongation factor G
MRKAFAQVLQPIMRVEVEVPGEFQGAVVGGLNQRRAMVESVDAKAGGYAVVLCQVPLREMFGYAMVLRGATEGKGEFAMEYACLSRYCLLSLLVRVCMRSHF